jgi:hypothetical protein
VSAQAIQPLTVQPTGLLIHPGTGDNRSGSSEIEFRGTSKDPGPGVSAVRVTMCVDAIGMPSKVKVEDSHGDDLEAIRAAIEVLTVVRDQLDVIDRRNRGVGPRAVSA